MKIEKNGINKLKAIFGNCAEKKKIFSSKFEEKNVL
jgi:hypothetical protein